MKINKTSLLFSLLALFSFLACNEEEKVVSVPYLDLSQQELTLKAGTVTSTSFSFSVEASDATIPYLCLYVDKVTIDEVPKGKLPGYLLSDLEKQAKAKNLPFEEYVASLTLTGSQPDLMVDNLLPGHIYEVVAFAIDGVRPANRAEYLFFETFVADPVECKFDVTVTPGSTNGVFSIKPSNKEVDWYFCTFPKTTHDQMVTAYGWSDEQLLNAYFSENVNALLQELAPTGQMTQETLNQMLKMLFFKGDQELQVSGNLSADTEYVWLAAAFKTIVEGGSLGFAILSTASKGVYKTTKRELKDIDFDIQATDITTSTATITVTPSDLNEKYYTRLEVYNDVIAALKPMEVAERIVNFVGTGIDYACKKGIQTYPVELKPGLRHCIIAFAYDKGIKSEPKIVTFDAETSLNDPSEMTFNVSQNQAWTAPYRVAADVVPSDETLPYATIIMPKGAYTEAECKNLIEMQVAYEYQANLQSNPNLSWKTFLYNSDNYKPGSRYGLSASGARPNASYSVCCASLTPDGKVAALHLAEGAVRASGLSNVRAIGKLIGCFDGDEEAGQVFGDPVSTAGKAIIVMQYSTSSNAYQSMFSLVEGMYNQLSDLELITAQEFWSGISTASGHTFFIGEWCQDYISFSYGVDMNLHEGPIHRLPLKPMTRKQAGSIDELRELVREAEGKSSMKKAFTPQLQKNFASTMLPFNVMQPSSMEKKENVKEVSSQALNKDLIPVTQKLGTTYYLPVVRSVQK